MLSQQEISDHIEIEQLMVRYANAIDAQNFDRLDTVFTADAHVDYTAMGGIKGAYPEIKAWLPSALGHFSSAMHSISNIEMNIQGNVATARVACFNPMVLPLPFLGKRTILLGFWYVDELVRTPAGWRISKRVEEKCYDHSVPWMMRLGQWWVNRKR